jgi:acetylornithine/N-succinyldiaminopimelate aminotransferase
MINEMRNRGILINCTADKVLRFVPPLVIEKNQIDIVTCNLGDVLQNYSESIKSY